MFSTTTISQPQNQLLQVKGGGAWQAQLSLAQEQMVPSCWGGQLWRPFPGAPFYGFSVINASKPDPANRMVPP